MDVYQYSARFQGLRGEIGGLPPWARGLVFLAAVPGIALVALSFLALLVSILALLLPTVPLYRLLRAMTATGRGDGPPGGGDVLTARPADDDGGSPRKRVEATVIDPPAADV